MIFFTLGFIWVIWALICYMAAKGQNGINLANCSIVIANIWIAVGALASIIPD